MNVMMGRPRLKFRWYVFAVISALAAAAATYAWLDGPRWQDSSAGPGADPHFSGDGKTLTTFHGLKSNPPKPFTPRIVKWGTASGRKLSDTPLEWKGPEPNPANRLMVTSPRAGDKILVGTPFPGGGSGFYYDVHNVETGKKIAGEIHTRHWIHTCSSDGRWCSTAQSDFNGITIFQLNNGVAILPLLLHDGIFPASSAFAPDGNYVAVHWRPKWRPNDNERGHFVVVYELPLGREVRRFDLPTRRWQRINDWESDNRLYAEVDEPDLAGKGFYHRRSYSFSMDEPDAKSERNEPSRSGHVAGQGRQTYWDTGDGWVAHLTTLQVDDRPPLHKAMEWIDRRFRTSLTPKWEMSVRVRMLDAATGEVRCEVPQARMGCTFSRDGRWIASAGDAVEVWSVPPPRTTLWSIIAGIASGLTVLGLGVVRNRARTTEPV